MLYKKKRDSIFRKKFKKLEKVKKIMSFLHKNELYVKSFFKFRFLMMIKKQNYSKYPKTKMVRRCILTNRNRGVSRSYNISRIALRNMFQSAIIPGYLKAVW